MPKLLPLAKLGESVLSKVAEEVSISEISKLKPTIEDMIFTLNSFGNRVGLAAPQVYLSKRIVIYKIPSSTHSRYQLQEKLDEIPLTILINPQWQPVTNKTIEGWEACISLPNLMGIVPRFQEIECFYQDIEGNPQTIRAKDFHARVIQHECDHLDGIVFTKKMHNLNSLIFEDVYLQSEQSKNMLA